MKIHIVSKGDTISSIANEYGISTERLIVDNGLLGLNNLVVGQSLIILIPSLVHTVLPDDTIYKIANQYNIDPIKIILNNPILIFNQNLTAGEKLTIEFDNNTSKNIEIYGFIYPFINRNLLNVQAAFSTKTSVFSYGFSTAGDLIKINDSAVLDYIKKWQSLPIMVLSAINENGSFEIEKTRVLFNDIDIQNKIIDETIDVMNNKGYVGIDLDFEYINPEDKDAYISFVANVVSKMKPYGYSVNVDLAPKTSDTQRGILYEGHDYSAIGDVADTVLLMTYEWGYTYGPPMAVAPINKVREVVEYGISRINPHKIYMGIPNYGYDWTLPYLQGTTKARSIGNEEAIRIACRYGAEIEFDSVSASPHFSYYDENRREHIVWFEDVRSIIKKYDLIEEFGLRGSGYWNLMRSFMQNWSYVNSQYNIYKN